VLLAVSQLLLFTYTADLSKDKEVFNFNDDGDDNNDLPFVKQILASLKWLKHVIDFIDNDNDNKESDDDDFIEVNWFKTTRTARQLVKLIYLP
jgi:hypothetical protein